MFNHYGYVLQLELILTGICFDYKSFRLSGYIFVRVHKRAVGRTATMESSHSMTSRPSLPPTTHQKITTTFAKLKSLMKFSQEEPWVTLFIKIGYSGEPKTFFCHCFLALYLWSKREIHVPLSTSIDKLRHVYTYRISDVGYKTRL